MGFAQELKEFTAGLQSGWKMMDDSEYRKAYLKARSGASKRHYGYGSDEDEDSSLSDFEAGAKSLLGARGRAFRAGDINTLNKLDEDIINYNKMDPNIGAGTSELYATGGLVGSSIKRAVDDATMPSDEAAPTNTEQFDVADKMFELASPGVDAGVKNMVQNLTASNEAVAVDGGEDKYRAFAQNEGAFTKDQIAALDQIIDPDNVLPEEAKSAARIAAMYEYYDKKGEPDKGAAAANGLLMYNKANSQTRGMLASQALEDGDVRAAAKLIADAYNYDLPGPMQIRPAVATEGEDFTVGPDGAVKAKIVKGNVTQEEINATPPQLAQMAQQLRSGQAFTQQLGQVAAQAKARGIGAKPQAKAGAAAPATEAIDTTALIKEHNILKRQHAAAETEEERARIEDKATEVYGKIVAGVRQNIPAKKRSDTGVAYALRGLGVTPLSPSGSAKAKASEAVDVDKMTRAVTTRGYVDMLSDKDVDTGEAIPVAQGDARSEATAPARARGRFVESMTTGQLGSTKADIRSENTTNLSVKGEKLNEVYKEYEEAIAGTPEAPSMIAKRLPPKDIGRIQDAAVVIGQKNEMTKGQVARLMNEAVNPNTPVRFDSSGRLRIGDNRPVIVDGATARQIMGVQKSVRERGPTPLPPADLKEAKRVLKERPDQRQKMLNYLTENGFSTEGL